MIHDIIKTRSDLGRRNRRRVLGEILFEGTIPRARIAKNVGLTAASVSRITRDMLDAELIEEADSSSSTESAVGGLRKQGRKFIGLKGRPGRCFVAGIAVNAFRQDVVVADVTNVVLASRQVRFSQLNDPEQVMAHCAAELSGLIDQTGIPRTRLVGCGLAVTGAVDPSRNILRSAPALGWERVEAGAIVARHLDCAIYMDSIPNAKNLAAHCFGATRKIQNVLLFNASLAIGCSLMINGQLIRGADFSAGLIEAMLIPDFAAGRAKPVDQLAGGDAIVKALAGAENRDPVEQLPHVIRYAEQGDQRASAAFVAAGRALAFTLINAFRLIDPERVVLSGPLFQSNVYHKAVLDELARIEGDAFVREKVRVLQMSSQWAAQSLAIHQSLIRGNLASLPAPSMTEALAS